MKKLIDLSREFTDFEGNVIKGEEGNPTRLKQILLTYLKSAASMNVTADEEVVAFEVGMIIGTAKGDSVELTQRQYDVVKKLVDHSKVIIPQVGQQPIFGTMISKQAKMLIDSAETVSDVADAPKKLKEAK